MIATARDIERIVDLILPFSAPTAIYLFGSQASGEATTASDIDLLIVEPTRQTRRHRGKAIAASLKGFAANFDLLLYTPEELAAELAYPLSFVANIITNGRIIYPCNSMRDTATSDRPLRLMASNSR